jgi:hypothetical protein
MRFALALGLAGIMIGAGTVPAMAQTYYQTQSSGSTPYYVVPNSGGNPYTNRNSATTSAADAARRTALYNQQQAMPGQNAPSYTFKSGSAPMTGDQAMALRDSRNQQAQQYQQDYLQQAQTMFQNNPANPILNTMPYGMNPQAQQPVKVKKRLIKREEDNPLAIPPRLFSID